MSAPRKAKQPVEPHGQREPTATERLQALEAKRAANDGLIVPMPSPLTLQSFREWLHAVAEIGSSGDVEIAWHRVQNAEWKLRLGNEYDSLRDTAGRRHHELEKVAYREEFARSADADERRRRSQIEAGIARCRAEIARLERLLD